MPARTEIRAAIEKVLRRVQAAGGRACPAITDATKPVGDLDEFDSLMAVEATVLLEAELNVTLAAGTPFVATTGGKRALTVAEIVDRVAEMIVTTRAA
jgi:acyl carrier protein